MKKLIFIILLSGFNLLNAMETEEALPTSNPWHELAKHVVLTHAITDQASFGLKDATLTFNDDGSLTNEGRISIIKNILKPSGKMGDHTDLVDSDLDGNLPDRPHLHWAWNQLVQPNSGGNWENAFFAILEPMNAMENEEQEKLFGIAPYDSLQMGSHRLSPQSTLLIPDNLADGIRAYLTEYQGHIVTYDPATSSLRTAISNTLERYYPETWHIVDQYGKPLRKSAARSRGGYTPKTYLQKPDGSIIQIIQQDGSKPDIKDYDAVTSARERKYIGLHMESPTATLENDDYFIALRKIINKEEIDDLDQYFRNSFGFLKACKFYEEMHKYDNKKGQRLARKYFRSALLADFCLRNTAEPEELTPELLVLFPNWIGAQFLMEAALSMHASNTGETQENYMRTLQIVGKLFKWRQGSDKAPTPCQEQHQLGLFFEEERRHHDAIRCYLMNIKPSGINWPSPENRNEEIESAQQLNRLFNTEHWQKFEKENMSQNELALKKAIVHYISAQMEPNKVKQQRLYYNVCNAAIKIMYGRQVINGMTLIAPDGYERVPDDDIIEDSHCWGLNFINNSTHSPVKGLINNCLLALRELSDDQSAASYARFHLTELHRRYNLGRNEAEAISEGSLNDDAIKFLALYNLEDPFRFGRTRFLQNLVNRHKRERAQFLATLNYCLTCDDLVDNSIFLQEATQFLARKLHAHACVAESCSPELLSALSQKAKNAVAEQLRSDPTLYYKKTIANPLGIDDSSLSLEQILLLSVVANKQKHLSVRFPCRGGDGRQIGWDSYFGDKTEVASKPHLQQAYVTLPTRTQEKLSRFVK